MRGKAAPSRPVRQSSRITPAYAGKRPSRSKNPARTPDHPRMCGEKTFASLLELIAGGSPPHVRGKEGKASRAPFRGGITPAYAGKRRIPGPAAFLRRDHPRVCGEKSNPFAVGSPARGSPPRMRGKVLLVVVVVVGFGITPAYAGKRSGIQTLQLQVWDHPRVCGEKTKKIP